MASPMIFTTTSSFSAITPWRKRSAILISYKPATKLVFIHLQAQHEMASMPGRSLAPMIPLFVNEPISKSASKPAPPKTSEATVAAITSTSTADENTLAAVLSLTKKFEEQAQLTEQRFKEYDDKLNYIQQGSNPRQFPRPRVGAKTADLSAGKCESRSPANKQPYGQGHGWHHHNKKPSRLPTGIHLPIMEWQFDVITATN